MCGIVGYVGGKEAAPILLDGLKRLEYRGYDSAGIAVFNRICFDIVKTVGKLSALEECLSKRMPEGNAGIGHTRWATHGRPSDINSHPHNDCSGSFTVVHNGIIENFLELKEWLQARGHKFVSETDTEIIPHLIEELYKGDLFDAVRKTVRKLRGSYAIGVLCTIEPGVIVAARKSSPLIVGLGKGENFLASDIPAILQHTKDIYVLEDEEMVRITSDSVTITNFEGNTVKKAIFKVKWDAIAAEKGGYQHFMLKEINEQPKAIKDTLLGRLSDSDINLNELKLSQNDIERINKIFIVACGTAYHAGLVGKTLIEKLAGLPVEVDLGSEFRYREPLIDSKTLVIAVSQSGETADTLAAMREAKGMGAKILAVTNVIGSSLSREADHLIYTCAGPEIAVASTKAYTTQLIVLALIALYLGKKLDRLTDEKVREIAGCLNKLPEQVQAALDAKDIIKELADIYSDRGNAFFIGRGSDYAVAMEGSLKLKELSYIHAEAYAAGELKHGTLALITEGVPVIAVATQERLVEKMVSNIREVKARGAEIIGIVNERNGYINKSLDHMVHIPRTHELLSPIVSIVPLQLMAYYMAVAVGSDVDKPRNLAKSVTVE